MALWCFVTVTGKGLIHLLQQISQTLLCSSPAHFQWPQRVTSTLQSIDFTVQRISVTWKPSISGLLPKASSVVWDKLCQDSMWSRVLEAVPKRNPEQHRAVRWEQVSFQTVSDRWKNGHHWPRHYAHLSVSKLAVVGVTLFFKPACTLCWQWPQEMIPHQPPPSQEEGRQPSTSSCWQMTFYPVLWPWTSVQFSLYCRQRKREIMHNL